MITSQQFITDISQRLETAQQIDVRYCEGLESTPITDKINLTQQLTSYLGEPLTADMLQCLSFPRHFKLYWEYCTTEEPNIFNGEGFLVCQLR